MKRKKKRLCIIIPAHWSAIMGGSQYQAKCLIDAMIPNEKYDIYYLTRRISSVFKSKEFQIIKIANNRGLRRYGLFFDAPILIRILKSIKPDVIYQRVGCAYTGIAALYAKNKPCKMIWHIARDDEVLPFKINFSPNIAFRYLERMILKYGIRNANSIIAQTNQQSKFLQKYYQRLPEAVVANFHPFPKEKIIKIRPIKVVWIANLKPIKQPEIFIRLASKMRSLRGVQFIMIGSFQGNKRWRKNLLNQICKVKQLTYLSVRSQDEVNELLSRAHIFVNTSRYEGFPNTFIQAWMRKVPVVSLNVDPDNILKKGGIGVHSKTFGQMVIDTKRLVEDKKLREAMGEKAQQYAFKNNSLANIEKIADIIIS